MKSPDRKAINPDETGICYIHSIMVTSIVFTFVTYVFKFQLVQVCKLFPLTLSCLSYATRSANDMALKRRG